MKNFILIVVFGAIACFYGYCIGCKQSENAMQEIKQQGIEMTGKDYMEVVYNTPILFAVMFTLVYCFIVFIWTVTTKKI